MITRILEFSLRQRAIVLLDTKREALEAGQQIQLLTGLDFNAVQTSAPKEEKK